MKLVCCSILIICVNLLIGETKEFIQKTNEIHIPDLGSVVGKEEKSFDGVKYEAFYGIPFGEPPVGDNRFGNFKAIKPWNSLLKAFEPKTKCIQKNIFSGKNSLVSGKEDCLYLNIYRPKIRSREFFYPVIAFIPGGAFFAGSSHPDIYGPEKLMKTQKVILVIFQYRLGPLGFFSTNNEDAEGNQGFKDQAGALKFIKKYIEYFNGNPHKITLVGHGAGAASAHLHMMTPQSKGLFNQVILLSGSGIAPYIEPTKNAVEQAYKLAEYSGIKNAKQLNSKDLVEKLKEIDAEVLLKATDIFHTNGIDPVVVFKLVLENQSNQNAFLTKHPKELSKNGEFNYVSVLTGILENDGSVRTLSIINNETEINRFNKNFNDNLAVLLDIENTDEVLKKIINYYLDGKHELNSSTFDGFQKLVSDRAFIYPFYETVRYFLQFSNKPVRLYKYDKMRSNSFYISSSFSNIKYMKKGPVHGDDILELFNSKKLNKMDMKGNKYENEDMSPFCAFIVKFIVGETLEHSEICSLKIFESKLKQNKFCPYTYFGNTVKLNDSFRVKDTYFWDNTLG